MIWPMSLARSDGSVRREYLAAIRREADIAWTPLGLSCEATDPSLPFDDQFCCDAQDKLEIKMMW